MNYFRWLIFYWDLARNVRLKFGIYLGLFILLAPWARKELQELGIEKRFIKEYEKELNHAR
jgi:hypothetical protein